MPPSGAVLKDYLADVRFLLEFGAARIGGGAELSGLFAHDGDGPPLWIDVVRSTMRLRRANGGSLEHALIPISGDGVSIVYYLDSRFTEEFRVVAVGPGLGKVIVAVEFCDFLDRLRLDALLPTSGTRDRRHELG
jgi:hypothetical protein